MNEYKIGRIAGKDGRGCISVFADEYKVDDGVGRFFVANNCIAKIWLRGKDKYAVARARSAEEILAEMIDTDKEANG